MLNNTATAMIPEDLGAVSFILNSNNLNSWQQKTAFKIIKQEFWAVTRILGNNMLKCLEINLANLEFTSVQKLPAYRFLYIEISGLDHLRLT